MLDVLWGQPIKLLHAASLSKLFENQRNDLVFFKIVPFSSAGPHKTQKLIASKMKYGKFGPKFLIPRLKLDTFSRTPQKDREQFQRKEGCFLIFTQF